MEIRSQTDTLPTQGSLIGRLRNLNDTGSWKEFVERYEQRVTRIARGQGLNTHDAEEVAQEVFKRVARTISEFEATERRGSFRRWLFRLTRWRTTDYLRERARFLSVQPRNASYSDGSEHKTPTIERVPAPCLTEALFKDEASRHVVDTLIKQIEHAVSPKQLQIFQLLVLDEAEPARVAELYGMSLTAVYVTKHRVAAKLREEISRIGLPRE